MQEKEKQTVATHSPESITDQNPLAEGNGVPDGSCHSP